MGSYFFSNSWRFNVIFATGLLCLSLPINAQIFSDLDLFRDRQQREPTTRQWSIEPLLFLEGTYSDNIALSAPGDELSDFVTEINPALRADLNGNRVKGELAYRMQNLFYADNSDFNKTFHQYFLLGNAELWREKFFLDVNSTLRQRNVSSQRFVTGNRNLNTDRTNQLTASVRPYFKQSLGSEVETLLQYEYGIVDFEDDKVAGITSDSQLNDIQISLGSPTRDKDHVLPWSLRYNNQEIDYDSPEFDDLKFELAALELSYPVTSVLTLIGTGGYEDNDLGRNSFTTTDTKGVLWLAGFRWQPSTKTQLEARFGERFFGNAGLLRWQQRGLYLTTEIRYIKDIGGYTGYALQDTDPLDYPTRFSTGALGLTARAYIRKRLSAIARLDIRTSQIRLLLFDENRDFRTINNNSDRWTGIRPSWVWKFATRTTLTTSLEWGRLKQPTGDRDDYPFRGIISLNREIGRRTQANLTYRYIRLDSNDPLAEYQENSITLGITQSF